jgi:cystathionine beta-lyase family protein involved in aluminum resistance
MGLFYAPLAVRESLKSGVFASALFEEAGFEVFPKFNETRADIVSSINLRSEENLRIFCKSIQEFSPVDSFLTPEPWRMPGYSHDIIMASGGFISGSSIELSADAPVMDPYIVWFQGGTNFYLAKYSLINVCMEINH